MLNTIYIRQYQRRLLFERGDFVGVLQPGRHFVFWLTKSVALGAQIRRGDIHVAR